jgi:hypothetical protein
MNDLKGQALAEEALRICHLKEGNYPTGITVEDLEREIRLQGVRIASDNHLTALRSALNNSQAKGTWRNADVGMWLPGDGVSTRSPRGLREVRRPVLCRTRLRRLGGLRDRQGCGAALSESRG